MMMVAPYVASQLVGGVLGAAMAKAMTSSENFDEAHGAAFALLRPDGEIGPVVPFMEGSTVVINILAGGDVSGTCLNPARAFGPAIVSHYWVYHCVYWVGLITGGLIAAAPVRLLLGDRKMRLILK
ncbi:aquaporin-8b [Spinachia spinachia]